MMEDSREGAFRRRESGAANRASASDEDHQRAWLWGISIAILGLFLVFILISFFRPEALLTDAAARLDGKDRVEAENAVRSSIIQVGGSIIVIGTLGLGAWRLVLTDRQLRHMEASAQAALASAKAATANVEYHIEKSQREEQARWEDKLRDAYADWAAALFYATIANCDIGDASKFGDAEKQRRAKEAFDGNHFKAETIMLRILMMERRPSLLKALKQIDREKFPDGPLEPDVRGTFWDHLHADAALYRDIVGAFLGLMRSRLERLSDLVTDPAIADFSLPDGNDYRSYIAAEFVKRGKPWAPR